MLAADNGGVIYDDDWCVHGKELTGYNARQQLSRVVNDIICPIDSR